MAFLATTDENGNEIIRVMLSTEPGNPTIASHRNVNINCGPEVRKTHFGRFDHRNRFHRYAYGTHIDDADDDDEKCAKKASKAGKGLKHADWCSAKATSQKYDCPPATEHRDTDHSDGCRPVQRCMADNVGNLQQETAARRQTQQPQWRRIKNDLFSAHGRARETPPEELARQQVVAWERQQLSWMRRQESAAADAAHICRLCQWPSMHERSDSPLDKYHLLDEKPLKAKHFFMPLDADHDEHCKRRQKPRQKLWKQTFEQPIKLSEKKSKLLEQQNCSKNIFGPCTHIKPLWPKAEQTNSQQSQRRSKSAQPAAKLMQGEINPYAYLYRLRGKAELTMAQTATLRQQESVERCQRVDKKVYRKQQKTEAKLAPATKNKTEKSSLELAKQQKRHTERVEAQPKQVSEMSKCPNAPMLSRAQYELLVKEAKRTGKPIQRLLQQEMLKKEERQQRRPIHAALQEKRQLARQQHEQPIREAKPVVKSQTELLMAKRARSSTETTMPAKASRDQHMTAQIGQSRPNKQPSVASAAVPAQEQNQCRMGASRKSLIERTKQVKPNLKPKPKPQPPKTIAHCNAYRKKQVQEHAATEPVQQVLKTKKKKHMQSPSVKLKRAKPRSAADLTRHAKELPLQLQAMKLSREFIAWLLEASRWHKLYLADCERDSSEPIRSRTVDLSRLKQAKQCAAAGCQQKRAHIEQRRIWAQQKNLALLNELLASQPLKLSEWFIAWLKEASLPPQFDLANCADPFDFEPIEEAALEQARRASRYQHVVVTMPPPTNDNSNSSDTCDDLSELLLSEKELRARQLLHHAAQRTPPGPVCSIHSIHPMQLNYLKNK